MAFLEKKLYVKKSNLPDVGKGLFTKKSIAKGTRIVEYKGRRLTWQEAKQLPDAHNGYLFYISSKQCIDAGGYKKALGRYANDAKGFVRLKGLNTNAEYVIEDGRCYIDAVKNIPRYGEIFVEYGPDYWKVARENIRLEKKQQKTS